MSFQARRLTDAPVKGAGGTTGDGLGSARRRAERKRLGWVQRTSVEARGRGDPLEAAPAVGRNDPCPCGSGAKAKRCCRG